MKNIFREKNDADALDAEIASGIARMYSPPANAGGDHAYWSTLERRITARIGDPSFMASLDSARWWTVLEGWSRPGLIAAGIAVIVSAALLQNQSDEGTAEYESVAAMPALEALAPSADQNDSVFAYVLAR